MHIPLIEAVADKLIADAKHHLINYIDEHFAEYLATKGKKAKDLENTALWNMVGPANESVCTDALGVNGNWFYKLKRDFEKSPDQSNDFRIIHKDSETLSAIFRRMGHVVHRNSFVSSFIPYVKKLDLPEVLKSFQIGIIRQYEPDIEREVDGVDWDEVAITANFKKRLVPNSSSNWYLYFYGYETLHEQVNREKSWPLVRLRLQFRTLIGQKDLSVTITNTENRKHYHYRGRTDVEVSTNKVLVINLRTTERTPTRQLNIKLLIDGAWGNLFVGQYSNYEADTSRIISGDLILEQAKEVNPVPYTFDIVEPIENTESYELIRHVSPMIPHLRSRFRQTDPIAFNQEIKMWQTTTLP
ncbi:hypothetical protein [uncultured Fibrella sp.]|uniref:hypothetical protein n=1 Tax=uncultured Fibrella sp. TaxID=1284596 RepID=UPI0035CABE2A